ncbi:MAG: RNA polymerase sigma-54 factor, partial [Peptostreptococcus anaerobius]
MISNKIQQTQTLKLNISNNLVQSLKILNMGRQELEEELENFSLSNPVLDVEIKKDTIDWEKYFKNERGTISYDRNESAYQDDSDYDFENMTTDYDSLYD